VIKGFLESNVSKRKYQADPVGYCEDVFGEKYTDDIKEMMESVRDNMVTVVESCNGPGKTHGAASVACWFFDVFEESEVYTLAAPPEENLKKLLWGEIEALVAKHSQVFTQYQHKVLNLIRGAKSFLTGVTIPTSGTKAQRQAKFSGKHAPQLLFIVDEGDGVPSEVYDGIDSCMSGGHVRLLILLNPREKSGPVYSMVRDGKAHVLNISAFNHPNVITGENLIPGAVDRETTVRRINQWCRRLKEDETVDAECYELPEFLVGVVAKDQKGIDFPPLNAGHYKITNPAFSYMVLGVYPAQAVNQLISKVWTEAAKQRWYAYVAKFGEVPPKGSSGTMGMDIAEFGNDKTQCAFKYGSWMDRLVGWSGMDPIETGDKGAEEYHSRPLIVVAAVEGNGVGAGVAPHMRRLRCNAHTIKVTKAPTEETELGEFGVQRDQLLWSLREWLRTDTNSMIPPDNELIEEMEVLTYEIKKGKIKVMDTDTIKELLRRSPDKLMAAAMTQAKVKPSANPYIHKPIKKVKYAW
jgi:hypothetical protein